MSHTLKPQRAQEPVSARTGPTDIGTVPARAAARVTKLGRVIVDLLARDGPMHTPGICKALDRDYSRTVPIMTALLRKGAIRIVGKAGALGFTDVLSHAPVYESTGITMHVLDNERGRPHVGVTDPPPKRPKQQRTDSGSGVIAGKIEIGRGYKWGAGRV